MKKIVFALLFLIVTPMCMNYAIDPLSIEHDIPTHEDELVLVNQLIQANQNNLQRLEKLKSVVEAFRKAQAACMQKPKNAELLFDMAKKGKAALDLIDEMKLHDYFRADFIQELEKMSQIAGKPSVPPSSLP